MASSGPVHDKTAPSGPMYDKMGAAFSTRTAANCCSQLLPHLSPTHHILDVGCGPASISLDLARLVPQGRVVALDISPDFLGEARAAASAQGVTNIEFVEGDAQAMDALTEDGAFDVVHAHMVLMHLSDPLQALREMRRLVKPGGIVACRDAAAIVRYPELQALESQWQRYEKNARARGAHPDGGKFSHAWAREAGFAPERIEFGTACLEWSREPARSILSEGVINSMRAVALTDGHARKKELDEAREAWKEWGRRWDARWMQLDGWILCRK